MRNLFPVLVSASALFLGVQQAGAMLGSTNQMQLGNLTGATNDPSNHNHYLIQRPVETIDYSDNHGQPNWVSWDLTSSDVGSSGRSDAWAVDSSLPPGFYPVPTSTYGTINGQSYDRGHMCPSADRTSSLATNKLVFIMSNIIPQASLMNQGVWANLENACRTFLSTNELLIMCGPYNFGTGTADSGHVTLSSNNWKVVVGVPLGAGTALSRITNSDPNSIRVIAVEIPNFDPTSSTWQTYLTSVKKVQADTGYNFFSALPNNLAWVLRSKVDGQTPAAPGSITFSPSSGAVNSSVTITGTALDTITNVTFNGTVASYNINSPTQITATVPAGATSGTITVKGLGGNAVSSSSFTVNGANPDLTISKTHSGSFTQGDTGDTYTIIVTNIGGSASSGTVMVTDTLPTGLTATGITGTGWTPNLDTLTCTRSDALAAGAAYQAITITVSVATNAASSVINTATVSGGGDTSSGNNSVNDSTTINAASAPTATTSAATSVGTTTATLNGTVNPNGQPATVQFQYGLTAAYGSIASVAGPLTGNTGQAVSANLTGLTPGTTYHFLVSATNVIGSGTGSDLVFTTAAPDLAITKTHIGNFTQGDTGDTYTITITNIGNAASSGTVTVTDTLPSGLTATAIGGTGWTPNLDTLTCTRSDSLAAGAGYPPITLTVTVATDVIIRFLATGAKESYDITLGDFRIVPR